MYKGNSYLAVSGKSPAFYGMPKPIAKPIREDGTMSSDLWRYLNSLSTVPQQDIPITVGPSPATFQATANGSVVISGTVTGISITRNGTYNLGTTTNMVPMSIGDILTITYSALPTLTWMPR